MNLRDAILIASRFCWKGKQKSLLKQIRLFPRHDTVPPRIFATNGPHGVLINLDVDVPNAAFDGETLAAIAKSTKEVTIDGNLANNVTLEMGDIANYPAIPDLPNEGWCLTRDWWAIEQILHAVSKDKQRPELMCLRFTPESVDATDRHRVARAFISGKWNGLVPAVIFKRWPKSESVRYAFNDRIAVFGTGDEFRIATLNKNRFEPCEQVLPSIWNGPAVVVDRLDLEFSVKSAMALDKWTIIEIKSDSTITVRGRNYAHCFGVACSNGNGNLPITLKTNAKQLHEALKAAKTPRVQLGFSTPGDPLRIDSGPLSIGIWPYNAGKK